MTTTSLTVRAHNVRVLQRGRDRDRAARRDDQSGGLERARRRRIPWRSATRRRCSTGTTARKSSDPSGSGSATSAPRIFASARVYCALANQSHLPCHLHPQAGLRPPDPRFARRSTPPATSSAPTSRAGRAVARRSSGTPTAWTRCCGSCSPRPSPRTRPVAILALGGYGRRHLCLHSDIDLLVLFGGRIGRGRGAVPPRVPASAVGPRRRRRPPGAGDRRLRRARGGQPRVPARAARRAAGGRRRARCSIGSARCSTSRRRTRTSSRRCCS